MRSKVKLKFGVAPITLYLKPERCGGNCIFCPWAKDLPHSYLPNDDTNFALSVNFCPKKQLIKILESLPLDGFVPGSDIPLEIILLGGSFSSLKHDYRTKYVRDLLQQLNAGFRYGGSQYYARCSVLTVESRPDQISQEECKFMRSLGVSKVEIGVQHTCDSVLKATGRGHTQIEIKNATRILKSEGFKVGYHVMIGLPGSNQAEDIQMLGDTLWRPEYFPDYLKIYPCELLKDRTLQPALHKMVESGDWSPPSSEYCLKVLERTLPLIPPVVRLSRIQRQFDKEQVMTGVVRGLRNKVVAKLQDVSTREAGNMYKVLNKQQELNSLNLLCTRYTNGESTYFEVSDKSSKALLSIARVEQSLENNTILRELKVFGVLAPIGKEGQIQGQGLGGSMLQAIENIAMSRKSKFLLVNAAPGARSFFSKYGYKLNSDHYMCKEINEVQLNSIMLTSAIPLCFSD